MDGLFQAYLRAGISGSVIILLVLLLRLLLKKAPRQLICILWILAAARLLLPFTVESRLSLQPQLPVFSDTVTGQPETPPVQSPGEMPVVPPVSQPEKPPVTVVPVPQETVSWQELLPVIWLSGTGVTALYGIVSYLLLKRRLRDAVKTEDYRVSDRIRGAFVIGYLHPQVYLSAQTAREDRMYIVAHEKAHIARGDQWWKLLGFGCLCLHWYNPLVWLSFVLFSRDTEVACDERVVWGMALEERKAYSVALLNCGKQISGLSALTLCFGKESLKQRIKNVLSFRKPGFWITVLAGMLAVAVAIFFLTSPGKPEPTVADPTKVTTVPTTQTVPDGTTVPPVTGQPATGLPTTAAPKPTTAPTVPTSAPPATTTAPTVPPTTVPLTTVPPTTVPPTTVPPTTVPPTTVPPTTVSPVRASGKCGENLYWELRGDVLTISGTGQMYDYGLPQVEWSAYRLEITTVVIQEGVTGMDNNAFDHFENLTRVSLPSTLQSISGRMFLDCKKLTGIMLPQGLAEIGDNAFFGCTALREIVIPASVTTVNDSAFGNCSALEKVTILGSPWLMMSFSGCTSLKEVRFYGDPPRMTDAFSGVTATAYYPANNPAWTGEKIQSYGLVLTWVAMDGT